MLSSATLLSLSLLSTAAVLPRLEGPLVIGPNVSPQRPSLVEAAPSPQGLLMMAYYPDWIASWFPPDKIDFSRFDWIDFAFALPTESLGLTWGDPDTSPRILLNLVNVAHSQGTKVKLSIGGWTGSRYFSPAVKTPENRQKFVSNIVQLYQAFSLDGIDMDWEYPGQIGGGNLFDPMDSVNFLEFLRLLRATLPQGAVLTAAVQSEPFADVTSQPMSDVRAFADVLDWILIMNYDVWGSSDLPGPNAPLYDRCRSSTQPGASAVGSFNAWAAAGFPPEKLTLGLPAYGYVSRSSANGLRTRAPLPSEGSQIQFRDLIKNGALARSTTDNKVFEGVNGFVRYWDECSSTPYLRSQGGGQIVTYDDVESLSMKAEFVKAMKMRGVNMFAIGGDTDEWDLVDAVRERLGLYAV